MSKRLTLDEVKEEISQNTHCKVISTEYVNVRVKLKLKCECGNEFESSLSAMRVRGKQYCNECSSNLMHDKFAKTHKQFKVELLERLGDEYTLLSHYRNTNTNVLIKHEKCGYLWDVRPSSVIHQDAQCPMCYSNNIKKTTEEFKGEVYDLVGDEFEVIGEYNGAKIPIEMKHNECENTFEVQPSNFLNYQYCIFCSSKSRGEDHVVKYLDELKIDYIREKRFDNCRNIKPLPFDFYLPESNILIEYDGIQHFKPSFNELEFKNIKVNDEIKDKYCKENNVGLLRIPYWEFNNIETILKSALI